MSDSVGPHRQLEFVHSCSTSPENQRQDAYSAEVRTFNANFDANMAKSGASAVDFCLSALRK